MHLFKWKQSSSFLLLMIFSFSGEAGEWIEHEKKIEEYGTKIRVHEARIRAAVKKKKETENPARMSLAMRQMVEEHAALNEVVKIREQTLQHMRFRHPERGEKYEAKYYRNFQLRSLRDYENEFSIEGRLNAIKEKVEVHYDVQPEEKTEIVRQRKKRKSEEKKDVLKLVK